MLDRDISIGGVSFNLKLTMVIIFGTFVPMLDYYDHRITQYKAYDRFILYFIIPYLIIWLVFREPASKYGFQFGNWKEGLLWVIPTCLVMGVFLYFFARSADMQAYYSVRTPSNVNALVFRNGVDLFGWEFVWRGFMLFTLARYVGPGPAIFLQAVPFAFMHLGKPEIETLSTIFGGAGFGFIAWRTKSFIYPWVIHWFIATLTMLVSIGVI